MTAPLAFVDTETTGLDPDRHEIWEVGLIVANSDPGWDEHTWQLPVDLARADPIALNIGRFHDRRVLAGELTRLDRFARDFVRLTHGRHLVGAVVSFDAERLWKLLRANDQCPMWHYHLVDVEALAAGRTGMAPPWDSNELSLAVGVDPEDFDRHTALGAARWAAAIYHAVMGTL
jgi:DNA polymerase III epsilon subunit-like protein